MILQPQNQNNQFSARIRLPNFRLFFLLFFQNSANQRISFILLGDLAKCRVLRGDSTGC